jgi:hypothetical protein
MPPGLALVEREITGIVAEDAQGSYFSAFTAEDPAGGVTEALVEWAVVPLEPLGEEPPHIEEALPAEETLPAEEAPVDETPSPAGEGDTSAIGGAIEIPVLVYRNPLPGSGPLEGYAWLAPAAFGTCPSTPDALVARPAGLDERTLAGEARAVDAASAPGLEYSVALPAAGDYVVAVCGCAPQLTAGELNGGPAGGDVLSSAANNASVYVGVNGLAAATDGAGQMLPIGGFAASPGYTWQDRWLDPTLSSSGAVTLRAAEPGVQTIQLWMADDGLIVYGLRLTPLAQANVEPGAVAAACGPSLGDTPAGQ